MTLGACGKQEEAKVDKAAADVKAKAEADAKMAAAASKELEAREIAIDAYIYGYPLVTMEATRRVMTNVDKPGGSKAPMGQFARLRTYPAVDDHSVTAPNADTLYTRAAAAAQPDQRCSRSAISGWRNRDSIALVTLTTESTGIEKSK